MELAGEKMRRQAPATAADGADARLEEVVAQRDSLKGQVTALEQQMAATRKELDEKKAELERIKKTIKG
jgi:peptidoglycan hydrolase CwlO-like protein